MYNLTAFLKRQFVLYIGLITLLIHPVSSQVWSPFGSGTNGTVHATLVYGSTLVVAGSFSNAGGQNINRIAVWNGSNWQPLGIGTNDDVYALTVYNGYLIAAGKFTSAGGLAANRIAVWNGSIWTTFGNGLDGSVYAMAVYGSELYVGGAFLNASGTTAFRIARWNGTWHAVGSGFDNDVYALASFGSYLIAGGNFLAAGSQVKRIAQWNGTLWFPLGLGIDDGAVYALRSYSSQLAVGGTFTTIGGSTVNRIARWNGTSWSQVGSGFSNGVYSLFATGSLLYAGGTFDFADFLPASRIAVFNGTSWSAVGGGVSGANSIVKAVSGYASNVVFAGIFTTAGANTPANNIASWGNPLGIKSVEGVIPENFILGQNYPNPFNPVTKIKFGVPNTSEGIVNVKIEIFDALGSLAATIVNDNISPGNYEVEFNAAGFASGMYFYRLSSGDPGRGFTETKKMIILK